MESRKTPQEESGLRQPRLGRDAALLTASNMVNLVVSMFTYMLLSRFYTLQEYGTYSQILLVINLSTNLFLLGLPRSINYFLPRAEDQKARSDFLNLYTTLVSIISLVIGIVLFAGSALIADYFSNPAIPTVAVALLLLPWSRIAINSRANLLVAAGKTRRLVVHTFTNNVLVLLSIFIAHQLVLSFQTYLYIFIGVELFFAALVYVETARIGKGLKLSLNKAQVRRVLAFSIPIGLASSVGILSANIDKLMIGRLMGTEMQAVFTNASHELPLALIPASLTAVLMPTLSKMMAQKRSDEVLDLWKTSAELSFTIMSLLVAMVVVFAKPVFILLYSEKYSQGVDIFRIYTLVLLFRITYFGMILNISGKTRLVLYSSLASLVVNAALNLVLFYLMGKVGPAVATVLSVMVMNLAQLAWSCKVLKVSFRDIFPWKRIFVSFCITLLFALPVYYLSAPLMDSISFSNVLYIGLVCLAWLAAYGVLYRRRVLLLWRKINA